MQPPPPTYIDVVAVDVAVVVVVVVVETASPECARKRASQQPLINGIFDAATVEMFFTRYFLYQGIVTLRSVPSCSFVLLSC